MTDVLTPPPHIGVHGSASPEAVGRTSPKTPRIDGSFGQFWLVQKEGRYWDRGRVLAFEPHLSQGTLGRSLSSNWRLNDPSVSRLHAALIRKPKRGVYVVDLGSRKGTFVNGQLVEGELLLMEGDRIRLGGSVLEFRQSRPHGISPHGRYLLGRSAVVLVILLAALLAKLFLF